MENNLIKVFVDTCRELGAKDDYKILQTWYLIKDNYARDNRFYHNLDHLRKGIKSLLRMRKEADESDKSIKWSELIAAYYIHDLVYIAGSEQNEEVSSSIGTGWYSALGISDDHICAIKYLVLSTNISRGYSHGLNAMVMHDIDYAVFAYSRTAYMEYSMNVMREYTGLLHTMDELLSKRKMFLEDLLKGKIFKTDWFLTIEQIARDNITYEIAFIERVLSDSNDKNLWESYYKEIYKAASCIDNTSS